MSRDPTWDNLRRGLDAADLPGILREIYQRVPEARALIATRLSPAGAGDKAPPQNGQAAYPRRHLPGVRPRDGAAQGMPDIARARRAVRDYRARSRDLAGTVDLLLTFVDEGTRALGLIGSPPASLFDALHAAADDIRDALRSVPRDRRPAAWVDRLRAIERACPVTHGVRAALDSLAAALTA